MINKLVDQISRRGMETPAIFFFEMHKPLSGLAANAMIVTSPFVAPFVGIDSMRDYSRLLQKPGSIEKIVTALEESAAVRDAKKVEDKEEGLEGEKESDV
ncbi:hypothetical protein QPK87_17605 [Kamptonema cortianum]|nr:hypothetical protein [Geitlerinema splendidum]MDK3158371.1 hypothetical protein [Kamptonema cortianum]